jgi:Leucine-rich repeat (LRR) protein
MTFHMFFQATVVVVVVALSGGLSIGAVSASPDNNVTVSDSEFEALKAFMEGVHSSSNVTRNNVCSTSGVTCAPFYASPNSTLAHHKFITELKLNASSLTGTLSPSLGALSHLSVLNVSGNNISGSIPHEWSVWGASLTVFIVSDNRLNGTLPPALSNWGSLTVFMVSKNNISGIIPLEYEQWSKLTTLFLNDNHLTGQLPHVIWPLLETLVASSNNLNGTLPDEYANMPQISTLLVDNNHLVGTLPSSYAVMTTMKDFHARQNSIDGTLPPEYGAWSAGLRSFRVRSNRLSGTLPVNYSSWGASFKTFDARQNLLSGTLPPQYSAWSSLTELNLRNNQLTGTLPTQYERWSSMERFDVSSNALDGTLPLFYANWARAANDVDLSSNQLTGTIPPAWGTMWTALDTIRLANNSLHGPVVYFASVGVLSISFNHFSGTVPSGYWRSCNTVADQVRVLDLQNNSYLDVQVPSLSCVLIVTLCGCLQSCSARDYFGVPTACCLPGGVANVTLDSDDAAKDEKYRVLEVARRNNVTLSVCPAETEAPNVPFRPAPLRNATTDAATVSSQSRATTAIAVVASTSFIAGDAADVQMLSAILSSPCTCHGEYAAGSSQRGIMQLALSPFSPGGPPWVAIGNSLLCAGFLAFHMFIVRVAFSGCGTDDSTQEESPSSLRKKSSPLSVRSSRTFIGAWLEKSGGSQRRLRQELLMRCRFPNFSMSLSVFLIPGIVRAAADIIGSVASGDDGTVATHEISALVIGIVFVVSAASLISRIVYHHAHNEVLQLKKSTGSSCLELHYNVHERIGVLFAPVPRSVARVALPRGVWMPPSARLSYGGVLSTFTKAQYHRMWCISPITNVMVQILSSIRPQCDVTQGIVILLLLVMSAWIGVTRPHRALLAAYLTSLALLLNVLVTLLAMLCRYDFITQDSVSSFGLFVSVVLLVMKVYHIALPFVEQWLLQRHDNILPPPVPAADADVDAAAANRGRHRGSRWRSRHNSPADENTSPPPLEVTTRGYPPTIWRQEDALAKLIAVIAANHRRE